MLHFQCFFGLCAWTRHSFKEFITSVNTKLVVLAGVAGEVRQTDQRIHQTKERTRGKDSNESVENTVKLAVIKTVEAHQPCNVQLDNADEAFHAGSDC